MTARILDGRAPVPATLLAQTVEAARAHEADRGGAATTVSAVDGKEGR